MGERPDANGAFAVAASAASLVLPNERTRPALHASCGSSRSRYVRVPPARKTVSPAPCVFFNAGEIVTEEPPAATTETLSADGPVPMTRTSPTASLSPAETETEVAPVAAVALRVVVSDAFVKAPTGTTVQK